MHLLYTSAHRPVHSNPPSLREGGSWDHQHPEPVSHFPEQTPQSEPQPCFVASL